MDLALAIQAHVLTMIPAPAEETVPEILPGRLFVPTEDFWEVCKANLLSTFDAVERPLTVTSAGLVGALALERTQNRERVWGYVHGRMRMAVSWASCQGTIYTNINP
jgi:hypothetical protein